jgi:dTDP-4-dehydrorhamnose reductase
MKRGEPMNVIFTGMNGTVAPVVAKTFEAHGVHVIAYDRSVVSTTDENQIKAFIQASDPKALFHFATGPLEWAELLAKITFELGVQMIYISTISVFDSKLSQAPYTPDMEPTAQDDYGQYKANSEKAVMAANPNASIYRLSWQITNSVTNNGMLRFIKEQIDRQGEMRASRTYYPSAAFLTDTADAVYDTWVRLGQGIYHMNSNDNVSFYDLIVYLAKQYDWIVVNDKAKASRDHRMIDERVRIKKLSEYLS